MQNRPRACEDGECAAPENVARAAHVGRRHDGEPALGRFTFRVELGERITSGNKNGGECGESGEESDR